MMRHVDRHLRQLSLAALTANPEDGSEDSESEFEADATASGPRLGHVDDAVDTSNVIMVPGNTHDTVRAQPQLRDHPLSKTAAQEADGLWHCPWEGEGYCDHKPSVLRADFEYVSLPPDSAQLPMLTTAKRVPLVPLEKALVQGGELHVQ